MSGGKADVYSDIGPNMDIKFARADEPRRRGLAVLTIHRAPDLFEHGNSCARPAWSFFRPERDEIISEAPAPVPSQEALVLLIAGVFGLVGYGRILCIGRR